MLKGFGANRGLGAKPKGFIPCSGAAPGSGKDAEAAPYHCAAAAARGSYPRPGRGHWC